MKFAKMNLKVKLILLFLLVGLIPMLVISLLSFNNSSNALRDGVFSALEMYSAISTDAMDDYFDEKSTMMQLFFQTQEISTRALLSLPMQPIIQTLSSGERG